MSRWLTDSKSILRAVFQFDVHLNESTASRASRIKEWVIVPASWIFECFDALESFNDLGSIYSSIGKTP